ncbi:gasdermin-E-like isoform X2 [Notolabrus celidotus]|uniref:gasdermin-E-like isoform X2 n=1 Tax=Notolabrus celidotus TaxID=1203425 RepID=UPI00149052D2|nr:gasdermin-E-like isoform X2 [Notolabrus celidotus]
MFATAARNFVEEVDQGGLLIPVSGLNDTINLLTVVVKRKRFWFWQKAKYLPTDFILNDILTGDTPIKPVVLETDFIKYDGTYGDKISGSIEANILDKSNLNVEGQDSSKLKSSFGNLKKEEVEVQKLLRDSKGRLLDMSHDLVQQTMENHRQVFGIVKERILTTQLCSVIEEVQQSGQCGGGFDFCRPKGPKVTLKENGSLTKDSNVTMEIPISTTIAYALIELEIKHDGHFGLCLMSGTDGGFEVDGPAGEELMAVSRAHLNSSENKHLREELERLRDHFNLLSALPAATRSSLLQHITNVMENRDAVSSLQQVLEQMCHDEKPDLDKGSATDSQKQNIQAILDLLEKSEGAKSAQGNQSTSALTALHLVVSAIDELPHECHAILVTCCNLTELQTLEQLVHCMSGNGELTLDSTGQAALTEDIFEKTKNLFAFGHMSLERDEDTVKTEMHSQTGHHALALCIAIKGLASLAKEG